MRNLTMVAMLLMVPLGAACKSENKAELPELTVEQVASRLKEANFYTIDNNDTDTFKEGHVPGAKWVDYKNVTATDLPANKDATLVFYCANEH